MRQRHNNGRIQMTILSIHRCFWFTHFGNRKLANVVVPDVLRGNFDKSSARSAANLIEDENSLKLRCIAEGLNFLDFRSEN